MNPRSQALGSDMDRRPARICTPRRPQALAAGALVALALAGCGASGPKLQAVPAKFAHVAAQSAEGADAPHVPAGTIARPMGTYIGPARDGRNACGYVSAGPGPAQASAFTLDGATCAQARRLAAAATGHEASDRRYAADGFECTGRRPGSRALLLYTCLSSGRKVSFVVG